MVNRFVTKLTIVSAIVHIAETGLVAMLQTMPPTTLEVVLTIGFVNTLDNIALTELN